MLDEIAPAPHLPLHPWRCHLASITAGVCSSGPSRSTNESSIDARRHACVNHEWMWCNGVSRLLIDCGPTRQTASKCEDVFGGVPQQRTASLSRTLRTWQPAQAESTAPFPGRTVRMKPDALGGQCEHRYVVYWLSGRVLQCARGSLTVDDRHGPERFW